MKRDWILYWKGGPAQRLLRRGAKRDHKKRAEPKEQMGKLRSKEMFYSSPRFDPGTYECDAELRLEATAKKEAWDEARAQRAECEQRLAGHPPCRWLRVGRDFFVVSEFVAAVNVVMLLGLSPWEAAPVGVGLAATVLCLVHELMEVKA